METRSNHILVGGVVLALIAGLLLFVIWLAGLSSTKKQCFDVYFAQDVGGLNKGSAVTFAGVPVGQITKISLLPERPEFVWVRIEVDEQMDYATAMGRMLGMAASGEYVLLEPRS